MKSAIKKLIMEIAKDTSQSFILILKSKLVNLLFLEDVVVIH